MPGMETRAPERTLTSSGLVGIAEIALGLIAGLALAPLPPGPLRSAG